MMSMRLVRLLIGAGALVLAGASGASAQEGVVVKSLLGAIGIVPKERPPIEYRERAPLVLPPKTELRAPASSASLGARGNWPKDPDAEILRKEAAEARLPYTQTQAYRNHEGKPLSIDEVMAHRSNRAAAGDTGYTDNRTEKTRLSPAELRGFEKAEPKLSGYGLERRSLSDPPEPLLKAQGGRKLKATKDALENGDPDSPSAFQREQRARY